MRLILRTIGLYTLAAVLFPWAWLREQPSAFSMAWLNTFGSAHEHVKLARSKRGQVQ